MHSPAEDLVRSSIRQNGPISFENFMDIALYSEGGYYNTSDVFGTNGDYYTSPLIHPIFGSMCALQIERMWQLMGCPDPFYLIEQGSGDGTLAEDILTALSLLNAHLYNSVIYMCVDRSKIKIKHRLTAKFLHSDRIELNACSGILLSNELIDSFPVKMIEVKEGRLFEVFVDIGNKGDLEEVLVAVDSPYLEKFLPAKWQNLDLYRGPLNTRVEDWYTNLSEVINKGFVLTIDYGYDKNLYYSMEKSHRLLQTYYRHIDGSTPYQRIGFQDITAHVDFDSLKQFGDKYGFRELIYCSQSEWLNSMCFEDLLGNIGGQSRQKTSLINLISDLNNPRKLGRFKILIQGKNLGNIDGIDLSSGLSWPSKLLVPSARNRHMSYHRENSEGLDFNFF